MMWDDGVHRFRDLIDRMAASEPHRIFLISPETARTPTFVGFRAQALTLRGRFWQKGLAYGERVAFPTLFPTPTSGGSVILPRGFFVSEFWNRPADHRGTWSDLFDEARVERLFGHMRTLFGAVLADLGGRSTPCLC